MTNDTATRSPDIEDAVFGEVVRHATQLTYLAATKGRRTASHRRPARLCGGDRPRVQIEMSPV